MENEHLKKYLIASLVQLGFTLIVLIIFYKQFPNPITSFVATIISSHLFFWFSYYLPRETFKEAKEKGRLIEQMSVIQWIMFGWFICFGLGSIYLLLSPIFTSEYYKIMFFTIPLGFSIGGYSTWELIRKTLKENNSL
ncbi:MAG: hypothetical protein EP305_07550 [Bacteroidetes bacterium]|nr:MAG: hypothetical protein EP305_07550 [Bacteroidota bacterium]